VLCIAQLYFTSARPENPYALLVFDHLTSKMQLSTLLWLLSIIIPIVTSLPSNRQALLQSNEGALDSMNSHGCRQAVPGDSPAFYVGDQSNDILSIDALDLLPNPPVE
jgi:hypothetical protein